MSVSKKPSILIVDDHTNNIYILMKILQSQAYQVKAAANGQTALMIARTEPPDLILLDINMPNMNGFEVCAELKKDSRTTEIPIIFVTAADNLDHKLTGFKMGGVDYITKPFQTEELLARVKTHLTIQSLQKELQQELTNRDALIAELEVFGHTVAHDIANPISGIYLMTDMLKRQLKNLTFTGKDFFEENLDSTKDLATQITKIIDGLMLLSQIRKGEIQRKPILMEEVIEPTLKRLNHLIVKSKAEIILPSKWDVAIGYEPWVEEIWANYIGNALKYGGSPPKIELGSIRQSQRFVTFWVRDNGNGIEEKDFDAVFKEFIRLDDIETAGAGLGLSIVRRIVTKLEGQVYVESEKGKGATFFFTLPAPQI